MEWNRTELTWWVDGALVKQIPARPHFSQGWPMDVALSFGVRPPLKTSPSAAGDEGRGNGVCVYYMLG